MPDPGNVPEGGDHAYGQFLQINGAQDPEAVAEVPVVIQPNKQMVQL